MTSIPELYEKPGNHQRLGRERAQETKIVAPWHRGTAGKNENERKDRA